MDAQIKNCGGGGTDPSPTKRATLPHNTSILHFNEILRPRPTQVLIPSYDESLWYRG